jgi:hypothetical protein
MHGDLVVSMAAGAAPGRVFCAGGWGDVRRAPTVFMTATILGVLGRLAGLRGDYAAASQLLENSQAALRGRWATASSLDTSGFNTS